ncbi:MAG: response regulator [Candidatus Anammoxibacter sp.]
MINEEKQTVLVVDDSEPNIFVLESALEDDYNVIAAKDGEKALHIIGENHPDLILLDIMMPGMDGLEVCSQLKNNEKIKDIPIIFITAKSETEDVIKGFKSGGVDYIAKPFEPLEVKARVKTHLALQGMRLQLKNQNDELKNTLKEIKTLKGLLPICSSCKKIRLENKDPKEQDSWINMESYISDRSEADFTHGICPECIKKLYPEISVHRESLPML